MNVTIVFIVLCNILCSLESMSMYLDSVDAKNSDEVLIKLPRTITDGSVMVIKGTFNSSVDSFTMTVLGEGLEKEEECKITLKPSESILEIISKYDSAKAPYQLRSARDTIVPFTFRMLAKSGGDTVETDLIHVDFEGNRAGVHSIEIPCTFTSFKNVDKLSFSGSKHIQSLTFDYRETK